jgi:hypothetical protein
MDNCSEPPRPTEPEQAGFWNNRRVEEINRMSAMDDSSLIDEAFREVAEILKQETDGDPLHGGIVKIQRLEI